MFHIHIAGQELWEHGKHCSRLILRCQVCILVEYNSNDRDVLHSKYRLSGFFVPVLNLKIV